MCPRPSDDSEQRRREREARHEWDRLVRAEVAAEKARARAGDAAREVVRAGPEHVDHVDHVDQVVPAPPPRLAAPVPDAPRRRRLRPIVVLRVAFVLVLVYVGVQLVERHRAEQALAGAAGQYAFISTNFDGSPVTWPACQPIHYVVNPTGAPAGWDVVVNRATEAASRASGFDLVYDGTTTRSALDPDGSFDDHAPVVISWAPASEFPSGGGDGQVVGRGGSDARFSFRAREHVFTTGRVLLDSEAYARLAAGRNVGEETAILMHELGHVLGLDHVQNPADLMYPDTTGLTSYGPGDLLGFAALGATDC